MKLIFLGAPGAGKGTHAEKAANRFGIPAVSTGNIIREAMKKGTPAGLSAKAYVDAGGLVPDETVIAMLQERLAEPDCAGGYILDGFPRNVTQAKALDAMGIVIDRVVDFEIADAVIEERVTGRRVCERCGAGYHVLHKPSAKGDLCEACGNVLTTRKDDDPAVVRDRLRVYHEQTEPLKAYYRDAGKLRSIDSSGEVANTSRQVMAALEDMA